MTGKSSVFFLFSVRKRKLPAKRTLPKTFLPTDFSCSSNFRCSPRVARSRHQAQTRKDAPSGANSNAKRKTNECLRMKRGAVDYQLKLLAGSTRRAAARERDSLPNEYTNIYPKYIYSKVLYLYIYIFQQPILIFRTKRLSALAQPTRLTVWMSPAKLPSS